MDAGDCDRDTIVKDEKGVSFMDITQDYLNMEGSYRKVRSTLDGKEGESMMRGVTFS